MTTETKRRIILRVFRDVGHDARVRSTVLRSLDMPTTAELAAVMRMIGEAENAYEALTAHGEWTTAALPGNAGVLTRTYHLLIPGQGDDREVVLYQNQRIEYSRYLKPYFAIHLDSDWDDEEVMREAIDAVLWRWGVDSGTGFDINFTTRADIAEDIHALESVFMVNGYPYEKGVRSITYDRRINVLVAELTADKEARDVAYPTLA